MARLKFIFDAPDRFLAGAVGEPGDRTFYLQARKGSALVSVGVEKAQVAALARRLDDLLDAVGAPREAEPPEHDGPEELEEPVVEVFRTGAMALAWDSGNSAVVIEAQTTDEDGDYIEVPDESDEGPDLLRVRLEPLQARGFVRRAEAVVAGGRPPCPFCGQPLDPQGHFCPRGNGQLN